MGLAGNAHRRAAHARLDTRRAMARGVGRERGWRFSRAAIPTGCGRSSCTGTRSLCSAPCTVSSETSWRSRRGSTRRVGRPLCAERPSDARTRTAFVEDGLANWPPDDERERWCTATGDDPRRSGATGRRESSARRPTISTSRFSLAGAELTWRGGRSRRREGLVDLPRDGRQRLRAPEGVRADGRRALARARPPVRGSRARADAPAADERGRGRYSLWTGDLGVALYLADCLDARTAYPVLDA